MPGRWGCFQRAGPSIARPCCAKSSCRPTELVSLLPSPSRAGRAVRGGESRGAGLGAQPFQAGCPDSARPAPSPPPRPLPGLRPAPFQRKRLERRAWFADAGCVLTRVCGCVNSIAVNQVASVSVRSPAEDPLVKGEPLLAAYLPLTYILINFWVL